MATCNHVSGWRQTMGLTAVVMLLLFAHAVAFAMTPVGAEVRNRAEATYTWQGGTRTTYSEEITVTVKQVAAVTLTPESRGAPGEAGFSPSYQLTVPAGNRLHLPYRITNTGNGPDVFELQGHFAGGSGHDPGLAIYHDVNEDGVPAPPDRIVEEIRLDAGESAALLLAVHVPQGASEGSEYFIRIEARSRFDGAVAAVNTWNHVLVQNTGAHMFVNRRAAIDPAPSFAAPVGRSGVVAGQGARLVHTIEWTNLSLDAAEDMMLWEPLPDTEQLLLDTYGPGKAVRLNGSPKSTEHAVDPDVRIVLDEGVWGLEIDIPRMQPGQRMRLEYEVEVDWAAGADTFAKQAEMRHEDQSGAAALFRSNEIVFVKEGEYALRVGPKGVVLTPGKKGFAVEAPVFYGEKVRFPTVVHHYGTLPGVVDVRLAQAPPAGWEVEFFRADGVTPLTDTNGTGRVDIGVLQPGSSSEFIVQVSVPGEPDSADDGPYSFEVVATFAEDAAATDATVVQVDDVQAATRLWEPLTLSSDRGPAVLPGEEITFAVRFGNDTDADIYGAVLTVDVGEHLDEIDVVGAEIGSAAWIAGEIDRNPDSLWATVGLTPGDVVYDATGRTLRWAIDHVPPGAGGKLVFKGRMPVTATEGTVVEVVGWMTSTSPRHEARTAQAVHTVLGETLSVDLTTTATAAAPGDVISYTATVTNVNRAADIDDVELWIAIPEGLSARNGSWRHGGARAADPDVVDGMFRYVISELPRGESVRITFSGIVNALAEDELIVSAQASFEPQPGVSFKSRKASVRTIVGSGMFVDEGLIVGQVLIDGHTPAAGVRVRLDDGRYAVTDREGRYTLRHVEHGPRVLRLDAASVRDLEEVPGGVDAADLRFVRTVVPKAGIAIVDFELTAHVIDVHTEERFMEGNER